MEISELKKLMFYNIILFFLILVSRRFRLVFFVLSLCYGFEYMYEVCVFYWGFINVIKVVCVKLVKSLNSC